MDKAINKLGIRYASLIKVIKEMMNHLMNE